MAVKEAVEEKVSLHLYGHTYGTAASVVGHLFRTSEVAFGQALVAVDIDSIEAESAPTPEELAKWVESGGQDFIYSFGARMMETQAVSMGLTLDFPLETPDAVFEMASDDEADVEDDAAGD